MEERWNKSIIPWIVFVMLILTVCLGAPLLLFSWQEKEVLEEVTPLEGGTTVEIKNQTLTMMQKMKLLDPNEKEATILELNAGNQMTEWEAAERMRQEIVVLTEPEREVLPNELNTDDMTLSHITARLLLNADNPEESLVVWQGIWYGTIERGIGENKTESQAELLVTMDDGTGKILGFRICGEDSLSIVPEYAAYALGRYLNLEPGDFLETEGDEDYDNGESLGLYPYWGAMDEWSLFYMDENRMTDEFSLCLRVYDNGFSLGSGQIYRGLIDSGQEAVEREKETG